jgi:hypothetical protein
MFPNSNSNGNPYVDFGILTSTCGSNGLNFAKEGFVSTLSIYSPVAVIGIYSQMEILLFY